MIQVFVRAVVFGVGVEAGREIYKALKGQLARRAQPEPDPELREPAPEEMMSAQPVAPVKDDEEDEA